MHRLTVKSARASRNIARASRNIKQCENFRQNRKNATATARKY